MEHSEGQFELSPSWLRQLLATVDALIVVLDLEGRVVMFNPVCERVTGRSFESLRGRLLWDGLMPEDELDEVIGKFKRLSETGESITHEGDWIAADGSRRRISWHTTGLCDPDGSVAYVAATGIEVSDLKESEERYRWLSAQTIEGITHHEGGVIVHVNDRCAEIFGYEPEEMVGHRVTEFATPESGEAIFGRIRDHVVGPYVVEGLRKDGSVFPLEIVTREAMHGGKMIRISGLRDVSVRRKLEEERERATEQLHRAQRMQTVGLLAGGIAHDFNNLLSVVMGSAELALQHVGPRDEVTHELHRIHDAAEVAATLTRQLLVFGGKDAPAADVLDVRDVVMRLKGLIEGVVGEAMELDLRLDERPSRVRMAQPHLEQVIVNLVVNAAAAMDPGGRLRICTRPVVLEREITTSVGQVLGPGDYVVLEVEDDGHGMDERVARKSLEPFFTTKPGGHGTGLGLSVVYSIVTKCEGGLELDTCPEKGTTWQIYLPATRDEPATDEFLALADRAHSGTVLVVEDEDDVRDLLVAALESGGYRVLSANGASQALGLFKANADRIQLLLSDVVMPEVTGPELAQMILKLAPELPILFISGYSESVLEKHGLSGAPLVQKPFRIRHLLSRVGELLAEPVLEMA